MLINEQALRRLIKEEVTTALAPYEGEQVELVSDDWVLDLDNELGTAVWQANKNIIEEIVERIEENRPEGLTEHDRGVISENALSHFYSALGAIMDDIRSGKIFKENN